MKRTLLPTYCCFLCEWANERDELVMTGLSRKIFSNALKIWHQLLTCLSGTLFTHVSVQTGYFKRFHILPPVEKWYTCASAHPCCYSALLSFFPAGLNMCCCGCPARCIRLAWPTTGKLVGGDEPTKMGNRLGGWAVCILKPSQHNPEPS